jgi:predicted PurR-regulated permease PerM
LWAVILAFVLYPLQRLFTRWFRGSRTLAACLVTLTVALVLAGPVVWIGFNLAEDGKELAVATRKWFETLPDEPPSWLATTPLLGTELASYWKTMTDSRRQWLEQLERASRDHAPEPDVPGAAEKPPPPPQAIPETPAPVDPAARPKGDEPRLVLLLGRFLGKAQSSLIAIGKALGSGVLMAGMSAFLAFFLLRDAEILGERMRLLMDRLTGGRGRHLMQVAGVTVKGVIFGILGTALVQAVVAGVGFGIAGVPGAILLSVITFFVAVIPFGPPLVWLPATLWLFWQGRPGWGVFMLLWGTLAISGVDNVLRPLIISQGSKLPFVLIFCGVVGGALAFGLVGVFLGPTLLAVTYRLVEEWAGMVESTPPPPTPAAGDGGASP